MAGHEIAHALREHARERLGRQQAAQLSAGTVPQLFGFVDMGSTQLGIGEQLLAMRYSPADETEADVIGSEIASRAGYDPRAAITLWNKIDAATRRPRQRLHLTASLRQEPPPRILKRLPDMLPLYAKADRQDGRALPQLIAGEWAAPISEEDLRERLAPLAVYFFMTLRRNPRSAARDR